MQKIKKVAIKDGEKSINVIIKKLEAEGNFDLMIKLVGIISRGNLEISKEVEQALHLICKTGFIVEGAKDIKEATILKFIAEGILGAFASLSNSDRDFIKSELIFKNIEIDKGSGFIEPLTAHNINQEFDSGMAIMSLLKEAFMLNFGFLSQKKD